MTKEERQREYARNYYYRNRERILNKRAKKGRRKIEPARALTREEIRENLERIKRENKEIYGIEY